MKIKLLFVIARLISLLAGTSSFAQVCIPDTVQATVASTSKGRHYRLDIYLPEHYMQDSHKTYPVVYLLDGQWDFPLAK